jgi:small subunit ribosomal protein S2
MTESIETLLKRSGIHIGTTTLTSTMQPFIKEKQPSGPYIFDLQIILKRVKLLANIINRNNCLFVASHREKSLYLNQIQWKKPLLKLGEYPHLKTLFGNIKAGILTNPSLPEYQDIDTLIISNPNVGRKDVINKPEAETQGNARLIAEASSVGVQIVGICNTDAITEYIDFIVPCNNYGHKSVATLVYLLIYYITKELPQFGVEDIEQPISD